MSEITEEKLQIMLDQAAEMGAERALGKVGLGDENAGKDVTDLRDLLMSWRDVKKTVIRTIVKDVTTFLLGAAAVGAWVKFLK